jgi:energy-coupling factor transport system ATP-binding protein
MVMINHNMQIEKNHAERVIRMEAGKIVEDTGNRAYPSREQISREQIGGACA